MAAGKMGKKSKSASLAMGFLSAKLFKKKIPLVIGWALTYRCNRQCGYCTLGKIRMLELGTEQILRIIDTLGQLGTKIISFTGGEPLLRDDIGKILEYCHKKGIATKVNSNGALVREKLEQLKNLDTLTLSFEGPQEVHDAIRGEGSYEEVMKAAKAAGEYGIKINFATVLTKENLNAIDFILDKAKEFNTRVSFQPATQLVLGGSEPNPLAPLAPEYRRAIEGLIKKKRKGNRYITNSISALRHLYAWPKGKRIKCASGRISCRIEPNGDVLYCSREKQPAVFLNCVSEGVVSAFNKLTLVVCDDCWCSGRVELNLAFQGNIESVWNQIGKTF